MFGSPNTKKNVHRLFIHANKTKLRSSSKYQLNQLNLVIDIQALRIWNDVGENNNDTRECDLNGW